MCARAWLRSSGGLERKVTRKVHIGHEGRRRCRREFPTAAMHRAPPVPTTAHCHSRPVPPHSHLPHTTITTTTCNVHVHTHTRPQHTTSTQSGGLGERAAGSRGHPPAAISPTHSNTQPGFLMTLGRTGPTPADRYGPHTTNNNKDNIPSFFGITT